MQLQGIFPLVCVWKKNCVSRILKQFAELKQFAKKKNDKVNQNRNRRPKNNEKDMNLYSPYNYIHFFNENLRAVREILKIMSNSSDL